MRKLILVLAIILTSTTVWAGPFLTSDAQEGVEEHRITCGTYEVIIPATADGAVWWDFAAWTGGHGWFDCMIRSRVKYEAVDVATGTTSEVVRESEPAAVRIKIPNTGSNANFQVTE